MTSLVWVLLLLLLVAHRQDSLRRKPPGTNLLQPLGDLGDLGQRLGRENRCV